MRKVAEAGNDENDGCLVIDVPTAGKMVGLNRQASYAAARRGEIPTITFGTLLKVPKKAWLKKLEEAGAR